VLALRLGILARVAARRTTEGGGHHHQTPQEAGVCNSDSLVSTQGSTSLFTPPTSSSVGSPLSTNEPGVGIAPR
jgi:hypothetical protein